MASNFIRMAFPNESAEYRKARNTLLDAEMELRRQIEAVAVTRRALPPGGEVPQDYVFERIGANEMPEKERTSADLLSDGAISVPVLSKFSADARNTHLGFQPAE